MMKSKPKKTKVKRTKAKRGRGRPTVYKPEYCGIATQLCKLGAINEDLAKFFGVAPSTVDKWLKEKPEFSGAIKAGREIADAEVAEKLFHRAIGYSHPEVHVSNYLGKITKTPLVKHYPPDTAAAFIWLKNRRPDLWRDKVEPGEENTPPPTKVTVTVVDASNADA